MENQQLTGVRIRNAREGKKMTQSELAQKCNLHIRTIQRIENEEVVPRFYTLRIIEEVLDVELSEVTQDHHLQQLKHYREIFLKRKRIRLFTVCFAFFILAMALLLLMLSIPKYSWAPYFYLLFFVDLFVIGITWRCPGCNGLLGDVFNVRYCSKCGLQFYD